MRQVRLEKSAISLSKAARTALDPLQNPDQIAVANQGIEHRGNDMRSVTDLIRKAENAERIARLTKAVLHIKKVVRHIPDDEVGESDLPQGKLKYDEVPDAANMLGVGGPGKTICTTPLSTGGAMLPASMLGIEITRTLSEAMNKAKAMAAKKDNPDKHIPSRKITQTSKKSKE